MNERVHRKPRAINVDPCSTCGNIGEPLLPCNRVGCPYAGPHLGDPRLSEMRQVEVYYIAQRPATYWVHQSEVDTFVEATKRLHFRPGRNPHTGRKCLKVWKIRISPLRPTGPFWWTVPDLQRNHDPAGARLFNGDYGPHEVVFIDRVRVNRWAAEEEAAEYADGMEEKDD